MTREQRQSVLDHVEEMRVYHLRRYAGYDDLFTIGQFKHEHPRTQTAPLAQGGLTVVKILFTDGYAVVGHAACSLLDNYCKAIGREMALGRAIKASLNKALVQ